jgi:thiamine-phosphate pyrophosphorylase
LRVESGELRIEARFESPAVYLITKGDATPENFTEKRREISRVVGAAVDAGVTFVQLREKKLTARMGYELACDLAALTRGSDTRVLVNDRADIAAAAGCHGVQLTATSLPADVVRAAFGPEFVIGVSTHSVEEVRAAASGGADFALFGPVFETPGKEAVQGLDGLKIACNAVAPFPVLAIGGIDAGNMLSVMSAGAGGFAAIRALNDVGGVEEFVRKSRNNL